MAWDALFCPEVDVLGHVVPEKTGGDEAAHGTCARMSERIEILEDLIVEGNRNEGTKCVGRSVAQKGEIGSKWDESNGKGRDELEGEE